jgi:hypothetical protein
MLRPLRKWRPCFQVKPTIQIERVKNMNVSEAALPDVADLVVGLAPVNLAAAANTGRWFSMRNCNAVNAILVTGIGTAGEDPVITFEQARNASGLGAKALTIRRVDEKIGGTGFTAGNDRWVRVASITRIVPANSRTNTDSAENEAVQSFYILATDLDLANNYSHIRMNVADVGSGAQIGCILYVPSARNYQGAHNFSALA